MELFECFQKIEVISKEPFVEHNITISEEKLKCWIKENKNSLLSFQTNKNDKISLFFLIKDEYQRKNKLNLKKNDLLTIFLE